MTQKQKSLPLWGRILAIFAGLWAALVLVGLLLLLFPNLLPREETYQRSERGESLQIDFYITSGDLFGYMPGKIRPPIEDALLASFMLTWDENGFRVPAQTADHYPIAAVGDSFTEAPIIEQPWVDLLAQTLGVPVGNYGYRGYGPVEVGRVVREQVAQQPRRWLIFAWFAGNDLYDIGRSKTIDERSTAFLLEGVLNRAVENIAPESSPNTHYDFPMPVIIGGNYYEMAFLADFLWAQRPPTEGLSASRNAQEAAAILQDTKAALGAETCTALVFIPTKEQLYYPYIYPTERQWLRGVGKMPIINGAGWLELQDAPITEAQEPALLDQINAQRDLLADLAAEHAYLFIDLLPPFSQAVANGDLLYYPYDTHWNPQGHALAAAFIAEQLANHTECPLE